MPIYVYKCPGCEITTEVVQQVGVNELTCTRCGGDMSKQPTAYAYIYMKGYPSFRKRYLGTAPGTTEAIPVLGSTGGPGSKMPQAKIEGEKWLEGLE